MDSLSVICARIADLREFSDYSAAEFATKIGISATEYSEYETGVKDIPIGILYNIATALEIDPSYLLFGKNSTKKVATVVYAGKGEVIDRYEGYSFTSLNSDFVNATLEPMMVTIKGGVSPELVQHKGQEFNYVVSGSLRVIVAEKEHFLKAGDSIYFDATKLHAQVAMEEEATFITVIEK